MIGFYLPCVLAFFAFLKIILRPNAVDKEPHHGMLYLISILFALQLPFFGIGGWTKLEDGYQSVHFLSLFPLITILYAWLRFKIKGIPLQFSLAWLYLGSLSSMLFADFWFASNRFDDFTLHGLGGAGFGDGLFITPLFATGCAFIINIATQHELKKKANVDTFQTSNASA